MTFFKLNKRNLLHVYKENINNKEQTKYQIVNDLDHPHELE